MNDTDKFTNNTSTYLQYFGDLPDRIDPSEAWAFNRWQATALGGLSLSIILAVISANLQGRLPYAAVLFASLSLPTLITYLMLESNRLILRSGGITIMLALGQLFSVLSLMALLASFSVIVVVLAVLAFAFWIWWAFDLGRRLAKQWSIGFEFPEPEFHRTKKDRLLWAICATLHEMGREISDISFNESIAPSDFDGLKLHGIEFGFVDDEIQFNAIFRRKLNEAASINTCQRTRP